MLAYSFKSTIVTELFNWRNWLLATLLIVLMELKKRLENAYCKFQSRKTTWTIFQELEGPWCVLEVRPDVRHLSKAVRRKRFRRDQKDWMHSQLLSKSYAVFKYIWKYAAYVQLETSKQMV